MSPGPVAIGSVLVTVACYSGAAVAALARGAGSARRGAALLAAAGALSGALAAAIVLISGGSFDLLLPSAIPGLALAFRADALGASFLALIGLVATPAALYGIGYDPDRHNGTHAGPGRPRTAAPHPHLERAMLPLFLLAMTLVVLAHNAFTFLLFWESMSLTSYLLVVGKGDRAERRDAGRWYFGMSHAGFMLIAAALWILSAGTPAGGFDDMRAAAPGLAPVLRQAVFLLALAGFASKAGLFPLHVWLPRAHPAAPSHVSALMSGVMLKLGLYGVLRIGLDVLGGGPPWWGGLILALGAVSALGGILSALVENDLKRLLAYSSVENLGILFMATGIGFVFHSYGMDGLAALAFAAALYHAINHAAFKGLLFLGSGSILQATGTRDMEAMGGLIRPMPQTAACFLIGAASIAALPPLNGFASEWLIFQSLLAGATLPNPFMATVMAVAAGVLALTGGLAAACFVKAFGIPFLAMPRSEQAERAREVPASMRLGMGLLAAACVLLGVLPFAVAPLLSRAFRDIPGVSGEPVAFRLGPVMEAGPGASSMSPVVLAASLLAVAAALPAALRLAGASRRRRRAETWGCGRVTQTARMEYTSTAFAEPLRRVFADLYRPQKALAIEFHPDSKYFVRSIQYQSRMRALVEEAIYRPLFTLARPLAATGRLIQSGSLHLYIAYIVAALLALLLLARWL